MNSYQTMESNAMYTWNKYNACQSLPDLLSSSKLSRTLQRRRSESLPCRLEFIERTFSDGERILNLKLINQEKKKSNPTIGELLGDDDLFHNRYHHYYSSSRLKRKRHHYRSYSRSSIHVHYGRRKQRRSAYSHPIKVSQYPDPHQIQPYSTVYSYTPLPAYCYYCYANMNSCYSCLLPDCNGYQQETSTC